jgi:hypothetical protein
LPDARRLAIAFVIGASRPNCIGSWIARRLAAADREHCI